MTCSCRFSEFGGLITRNNEQLGSEIAIKTTRSSHVETCVLLVRECTHDDEMISIKVNLQGIQLDQGEYKPEEKPTYGNIKKWIKEKYSMNASNLYIGQIKDKIGLEKCQNYNIGFGEGRVPSCPSEKEKAIMKAFKHFNLI